MRVYHGSNRNFRVLRISNKLVNYESTRNNEGIGIYFSTERDVAESYGKYIYELEINNKHLLDFRKISVCKAYIQRIRKYIFMSVGVDIQDFLSLETVSESIQNGTVAISGTCNEIALWLDSNDMWHRLPNRIKDKIKQILRTYDKNNLKAYMFTYHIRGVGVCKTTDTDVVRIVGKYTRE